MTVSEFLLNRLNELNVNHLFGIPGDYVLPFFDELIDKPTGVTHVNSRNELNAGYSADGYAKKNGFGALAVTFGVGSLSATNAVAGAYADNTPLILISGAPARSAVQTINGKLLHHLVDQRDITSLKVFEQVTIKSHRLNSLETAAQEIDELLILAYKMKKPVYLEIPYDLQKAEIKAPSSKLHFKKSWTSKTELNKAIKASLKLIKQSKSISSVVGPLLDRNKMQNQALTLIEQLNLPVATVFTAKLSDFESHKNAVGIYQGHVSEPYTTEVIESADLSITIGNTNNEFDTGVFTSDLGKTNKLISIHNDNVIVDGVIYQDVFMTEFLPELIEQTKEIKAQDFEVDRSKRRFAFEIEDKFTPTDDALTIDRMFVQFANYLQESDTLVGDTGGYINATQAEIKKGIDVYGCGNWGSLGAGFGMSVGASFAKKETEQGEMVSITGDGAFLMSAQELSTLIEHKNNVTLIVLDNSGYGAERQIYPGKERSYNDFLPWNYEQLGTAFGGVQGESTYGFTAKTEKELDQVFEETRKLQGVKIVRVYLDPWDSASFNVRFSKALRH